MTEGRARARRWLRPVVVVALVAALALFGRRLDWSVVAGTVRDADRTLLAAAVAVNLVSLALRGVQWWVFLRPLGVRSLPLALRGTVVGSAMNAVVAAHAGEGARVLLVARAARVPSAGVLAALALERLLDGVSYLALLTAAAWLLDLPPEVRRWRVAAAVLLALLVALLLALAAIAGRDPRPPTRAPDAGRRRLRVHLRFLRDAFLSLASLPRLAAAVALSLAAWALQVATYHLVARAADLPLPLAGSVAALLTGGLGFLLRATPGNVGVFQVVYALTARGFGVAEGPAVAAALLLQAAQTIPTLVAAGLLAPRLLQPRGSDGERRHDARS